VTATITRIRAGAPAPADSRAECRLSTDVIADMIQAGSHRRNALAANHTSTPCERDYAERYSTERAIFWWLAGPLSVAIVVGAYLAWRAA